MAFLASSNRTKSERTGYNRTEPLSKGSRYHLEGKCKPCAFFHSKGCANGPACTFCHECPPHEAQRRQRLRRQLLRGSSDVSDASTASVARESSRQSSAESTGEEPCSQPVQRAGPSVAWRPGTHVERWPGERSAMQAHTETDDLTVVSCPSIGVSVHLDRFEHLAPTAAAAPAALQKGFDARLGAAVQFVLVPMVLPTPLRQQPPPQQQPLLQQAHRAASAGPEAEVTAVPASGCESPAAAAGF
mmetsp:Transcript_111804/g.326927  ORF Transcript_111804/g.326927 Transcript_111804/m.326927 type:complete len:245 (+) Transcript_111804:63-797(+)